MSEKNLSEEGAKKLISELFQKIRDAKNAEELRKLQNEKPYCDFKMQGKEFPRLRLRISAEEIDNLRSAGIISKDNFLAGSLADGVYRGSGGTQVKMTSLEKLLYSILWKNGHLLKERHVILGITEDSRKKDDRIVFYEYGGYLSGRNSFILDQHTLRCFAIHDANLSEIELIRAHRDIQMHKKRDSWKEQMEDFYRTICEPLDENDKADFAYETDRLLFGAGRFLKNLNGQAG